MKSFSPIETGYTSLTVQRAKWWRVAGARRFLMDKVMLLRCVQPSTCRRRVGASSRFLYYKEIRHQPDVWGGMMMVVETCQQEITGSDLQSEHRPQERMFVTHRVGSTENVERMLGFRARTLLEGGLRSVVEWRCQDQRRALSERA